MNTAALGLGGVEAHLGLLLFVMVRIGAALLAAPFFSAAAIPVQLRIAIAGACSILILAWLPPIDPPPILSLPGLLALMGEALIGLTLGFVLQLSFAAPVIAAEQIGGAMGLSIASAVDPVSGAHSPALAQYFTIVLNLIFLSCGGHLVWLGLVVQSYQTLPPGGGLALQGAGAVIGFGGAVFSAALAIALPVTLILLMVQFAAGILSRAAPSLNLFALGLPAGVLSGLAALIIAAPLTADQLTELSASAIDHAERIVAR